VPGKVDNFQAETSALTGEQTAIVVLGMHRSGTSSVAGALSILGAAPPRTLMQPAEDNPKGFWESEVLMSFNDDLLRAGGSSWSDWRNFDLAGVLRHSPGFLEEGRQRLDDEFCGQANIVVKDPRICRFFPFWQRVLEDAGYRVVVVSPLRSPREVASSLLARNTMTVEQAGRLWLSHVLAAERASRGLPRLFIEWSTFLENWRESAKLIKTVLGLSLNVEDAFGAARIDEFLSADLRRQRSIAHQFPEWIDDAYQILVEMAHRQETRQDHDRLDEIRWGFDQACRAFDDSPH